MGEFSLHQKGGKVWHKIGCDSQPAKQDEDGEKSNVTELLIEKHRNGPTGKVTLHFDDKKATFQEVDTNSFDDFSVSSEAGDDEAF